MKGVNTQTEKHTLERAFEGEDLAKQGSETLLQIPMPRIRDPRGAARPRQMQRKLLKEGLKRTRAPTATPEDDRGEKA